MAIKECSVERYDHMLGILPPALWLGKGFLVGDAPRKDFPPAFAPPKRSCSVVSSHQYSAASSCF
jgi:hypothetical protein